jgi:hypothetical protein
MDTVTISGTVYEMDGETPKSGGTLHVRKVVKGGELISTKSLSVRISSEGEVEFTLPRACEAWIDGPVFGFDTRPSRGVRVDIPDVAEYAFGSLVPGSGGGSTSASQSAINAEVAARVAAQTLYTQTIDEDTELDVGDALRALILMDTSAGEVTATLQPLDDMEGREITFKKISDDNTAHVDAGAMELIDGRMLFDLEMLNSFVTVVAAGGQWQVVAKG